jgi:hypothetical protein
MQRYGDNESHNYIIGGYTDLAVAAVEGLAMRLYRDNKYEPKITMIKLDSNETVKDIPKEVFTNYAKMKYPEKFDYKGDIIDE